MAAETLLPSLLGPLVGGRVYPDVAPEGAGLPRIVYQQVGGQALVYREGTLPTRENGRYQVACWAAARLEAVALAQQIEAALVATPAMQAEPIGARLSRQDPDTSLYGCQQDFSIWSPR